MTLNAFLAITQALPLCPVPVEQAKQSELKSWMMASYYCTGESRLRLTEAMFLLRYTLVDVEQTQGRGSLNRSAGHCRSGFLHSIGDHSKTLSTCSSDPPLLKSPWLVLARRRG